MQPSPDLPRDPEETPTCSFTGICGEVRMKPNFFSSSGYDKASSSGISSSLVSNEEFPDHYVSTGELLVTTDQLIFIVPFLQDFHL